MQLRMRVLVIRINRCGLLSSSLSLSRARSLRMKSQVLHRDRTAIQRDWSQSCSFDCVEAWVRKEEG